MENLDAIIGAIGYALAALGFLLLTGLLLTSFRQRLRSMILAGAGAVTALWAAAFAAGFVVWQLTTFQVFLLEFSLDAAWI
ncbi:MAG: PEP-CTERM system histidine kinase PrsK, partial [Gammaproteobacteria bacterium]|nr:PEP-CTERM system histidine kinase PrsK [Gammaproteobacteria bacterium]